MLFMGISSPDLAGLAIEGGMTGVILDCEHGFPMGTEIRTMVLACHAAGGRCLVRIAPGAVTYTGVLADLGVDGILLSLVRSLEDVQLVSRLAAFPGAGIRSVNPFVPAARIPGDLGTLHRSASRLDIWAMAETGEFLEQLDHLPADVQLNGNGQWNGILIGPYDLAAALGSPNDPQDRLLREAVARYVRHAQDRGLAWGMFVRDVVTLERWADAGITPSVVVVGYDRDIWFQECASRVRAVLSRWEGDTHAS